MPRELFPPDPARQRYIIERLCALVTYVSEGRPLDLAGSWYTAPGESTFAITVESEAFEALLLELARSRPTRARRRRLGR